ncbi:hypothetical protein [Pedobacter heparinus]|uniref:hypothetical protein n=1 Tax=Pedobacter heparinus TaxID=984 RepID=UPI0029316158|nr:hypothetical protein [Pedobacter heparinus]
MIKLNLLQIGILSILIFDIIGSLSSRWIGFNYQYLTPLSFLIYCTISFLATRKISLKKGVWYNVLMGLFDSTIGWLVSILLEANTGDINIQPYSVNFFVMMVFSMVIIASIMGLIGGGIALLTKKKPVSA